MHRLWVLLVECGGGSASIENPTHQAQRKNSRHLAFGVELAIRRSVRVERAQRCVTVTPLQRGSNLVKQVELRPQCSRARARRAALRRARGRLGRSQELDGFGAGW
jgi:hypothetical protein